MIGQGETLTPRKRAVLAAIAAGLSQVDAAKATGISCPTVSRYVADPVFQAALRDAQDATLGQITLRMTDGSNAALDLLQSVMADQGIAPAVRVRAALGWLDAAWKARELHDIEQRIAELERRANDANGN